MNALKQRLAAAKGPTAAERRVNLAKAADKKALAEARAHLEGTKGGAPQRVVAPSAQTGGYVARPGLVNVHPAEVIVPQRDWRDIIRANIGESTMTTLARALGARAVPAQTARRGRGGAPAGAGGAGNVELSAKIDNLGKLTLTAENFFEILSAFDQAKANTNPWGIGIPR